MAGFLFRLESEDGTPAEPSTLEAAVPNWRQLRVVRLRDDEAGRPVLVVEDVA